MLHLSCATELESLSGRVAALYQCEQGSGPAHTVARYIVSVLPVVKLISRDLQCDVMLHNWQPCS